MKQEELEILDRFDTVWQRVMGESPTQSAPKVSESDEMWLEQLMEETLQCWQEGMALAQRMQGEQAGQLMTLAAVARRQFRQMQVEYFLKTGDTYPADRPVPRPSGILTGMRQLYLRELALAKSFAYVGQREGEMYRNFGIQAQDCAQCLRQMIAVLLLQ